MRRKHVVQMSSLPTRREYSASLAKLAGKAHLHACTNLDCLATYEDNCSCPAINGRCSRCRGHRVPVWETARAPQPCCVDNTAQVVRVEELLRYDLAGPGPWFQCKTCARCHSRPHVTPPKGKQP